jgi:hypothetical protein
MKHHWADFLDNESGYFHFTENLHRGRHNYPDLAEVNETAPILMITGMTTNWELLPQFTALEELTLHEPTAAQFEVLKDLPWLKRLRVSFFGPASLEPMRGLLALVELVLEYVSKFDDLSPLAALPNLRAVHFENLRRVHDFSGLRGASIRTLTIYGTVDWDQPIDSLDFLEALPQLERFRTGTGRIGGEFPILAGIAKSKASYFYMAPHGASLEDFAWLVAKRPDLRPCLPYIADEHVPDGYHPDRNAKMDTKPGMTDAQKKEVAKHNTMTRYYWPEVRFLGKGERKVKSCDPEDRQKRIRAFEDRFKRMVDEYRIGE